MIQAVRRLDAILLDVFLDFLEAFVGNPNSRKRVRDGAAVRAASGYLFTYRSGKVLATLNVLSIDLQSQTPVLTRNNPAPVLVIRGEEIRPLDGPSSCLGSRRGIRPNRSPHAGPTHPTPES